MGTRYCANCTLTAEQGVEEHGKTRVCASAVPRLVIFL